MASGGLSDDGSRQTQGGGDVEQNSPIFTSQPHVTGEGEYTAMEPLTCDGDGCGKQEDVDWYCKNCPCSLCESCKKTHEASRMTGNHTIVRRTGEVVRFHKFTRKREQCTFHHQEDITMFCSDCKAPCCTLCIEEHQRHAFQLIEKLLSNVTSELVGKLTNIESTSNSELKNQEKTVLKYYETMQKTAISNLETERGQVVHLINELYNEKVKAIEKETNVDVEKIKASTGDIKSERNRRLQKYRDAIERGSIDLIDLNSGLSDQASFWEPSTYDFKYPVFYSTVSLRSKLEDLESGKIHYISTTRMDLKTVAMFELDNCCTSLKLGNIANNVEGCIKSGGFLIFDKDKFKTIQTLACTKECFDFVRTNNDDILFSDQTDIWKMSPDSSVKIHIKEEAFDAYGLCINNKSQIVVCMDQSLAHTSHLSVYSADGQTKLKEIRHEMNGQNVLSHSRYVIQNGNDYCVVNLKNTLDAFDINGAHRWTYGDDVPPGCQQMPKLRCVSNDAQFNIYVVDGVNKCIHFLNKDGNFLYLISREQTGISSPVEAMVVDSVRNQIWTVHDSRKVTILGYQLLETEENK